MADQFDPALHLKSLLNAPAGPMFTDKGQTLVGITGATGVQGERGNGEVIGADLVKLAADCAFPDHTHAGDHIVYVLSGSGAVFVEGIRHPLETGDSAYIASDMGHGLSAKGSETGMTVIVFSVPHQGISHTSRLKVT